MWEQSTAAAPSRSRRVWWILAGLFGALVAAYLVAYAAAGTGIARGTTVLGVSIGGMTPESARQVLARELRDGTEAAIPVTVGPLQSTVDPVAAGLSMDIGATVDAAGARSWNPVELVAALTGEDEVDPVVRVERALLRAAVDDLAAEVAQEPVDGGVAYDKDAAIVRTEPQPGVRLERAGARRALRAAYLSGRHLRSAAGEADVAAARLPANVVRPAIDEDEVERTVTEVAEPAVAEPVEVTVAGSSLTVGPRTIARALTFVPAGAVLEPALDGRRLHRALADELAAIEQPARDASFDVSSGRPRVVPARQGRAVLPDTLASAVLPVLSLSGSARAVDVPLEKSEPEISTADARDLGVRELIGEFTTYYPSNYAPRLQNIHRAADLLDDTLVLPGETFSFNETVGERTAARGFAPGFIISGGIIEVDYGGGVSQLVTTTFNAGFFAGLEIVEHNPHSFYISRYPEGRESTVAWGVKDLRMRNDYDTAVFLTTSYTSSSVTVRVWGTKVYRIEATKGPRYDITPFRVINDSRPAGVSRGDCVPTSGVPGFKVVVERIFYKGNARVRTEEFHTTYQPEHEVRCDYRKPAPEPEKDPYKPAKPQDDKPAG